MNLTNKHTPLAFLFLFLILFSVGCVTTTIQDNDTAYVYVAENGTITYRGTLYSTPEDVADKLLSDGATPATLVTLITQGSIPTMHLMGISNDFGRKGLSHVVIREKKKVSASIQKRGTGIKPPSPASVPKMKRPSKKSSRNRYGDFTTEGESRFRMVEP